MTLDLRDGAAIKIVAPGSMNIGAEGTVRGKRDGNYSLNLVEKLGFHVGRLFGIWWVDAALRGAIDQLPLTNVSPKVDKASSPYVYKVESKTETEKLASSLEGMEIEETKKPSGESKTLRIIQSHSLIEGQKDKDNCHRWELQLDPEGHHLVKKVIYQLHPTFTPKDITCTEAPFSISRIGWGVFPVNIIVELKSGHKIETVHKLTFKTNGTNVKETEVPISK